VISFLDTHDSHGVIQTQQNCFGMIPKMNLLTRWKMMGDYSLCLFLNGLKIATRVFIF